MSIIGDKFKVCVTHPIGSIFESNENIIFKVNYGEIEGVLDAEGNPQKAYILGVDEPVSEYEGRLIAIVHRTNDLENIWVISNFHYSKEEIKNAIDFMEKYFNIEVIV